MEEMEVNYSSRSRLYHFKRAALLSRKKNISFCKGKGSFLFSNLMQQMTS